MGNPSVVETPGKREEGCNDDKFIMALPFWLFLFVCVKNEGATPRLRFE
jgi:hypothetical protein